MSTLNNHTPPGRDGGLVVQTVPPQEASRPMPLPHQFTTKLIQLENNMKTTILISIMFTACVIQAVETLTYSYTPAGRLTTATYDSGATNATVRYVYDDNSGLTKRTATFSTDGDTLDDVWEMEKFGDLTETDAGDPDNDGLANTNEFIFGSHPDLSDTDNDNADDYHEYIADTDPNNPTSRFEIASVTISNSPPSVAVTFPSSASRQYTLRARTNLTTGIWTPIPSQTDIPGSGKTDTLTDTNDTPIRFYQVEVEIP